MAHGQAPRSAMDRATFAVVMGVLAAVVYVIIGVVAHYLNVDAGPMPGVIVMLVVGLPVWKRSSNVRSRRHPEDHGR